MKMKKKLTTLIVVASVCLASFERPIYRAGIYVGVERYIITPGYWTTSY